MQKRWDDLFLKYMLSAMLITGIFFGLIIFTGCGSARLVSKRGETSPHTELDKLKDKIFKLEGTAQMITNFAAGDFSDCATALPPFETKVCQIAQTANAENLIKVTGQLSRVSAEMQTSLYGEGCADTVEIGCPEPSSVLDKLDNIDPADITDLQTAVNDLESFKTLTESRLDAIESIINGKDYYQWVFLCSDIIDFNEPVLRTGDKTEIRFYSSSTSIGMARISIGDGDQYVQTSVSPKCKVKFYDLGTEYNICWNNQNKNASEVSIDTECGNGIGPFTADCTCI